MGSNLDGYIGVIALKNTCYKGKMIRKEIRKIVIAERDRLSALKMNKIDLPHLEIAPNKRSKPTHLVLLPSIGDDEHCFPGSRRMKPAENRAFKKKKKKETSWKSSQIDARVLSESSNAPSSVVSAREGSLAPCAFNSTRSGGKTVRQGAGERGQRTLFHEIRFKFDGPEIRRRRRRSSETIPPALQHDHVLPYGLGPRVRPGGSSRTSAPCGLAFTRTPTSPALDATGPAFATTRRNWLTTTAKSKARITLFFFFLPGKRVNARWIHRVHTVLFLLMRLCLDQYP